MIKDLDSGVAVSVPEFDRIAHHLQSPVCMRGIGRLILLLYVGVVEHVDT